jgi:hypothetical protein
VNDARSMGLLFGTAAGPVAGRDAPGDVEKRMRALACYLAHDSAASPTTCRRWRRANAAW